MQKQPPEVFYKKGVLRKFAKFTGKRLCQSLFFNKVTGLRPYFFLFKDIDHAISWTFLLLQNNQQKTVLHTIKSNGSGRVKMTKAHQRLHLLARDSSKAPQV